MAQNQKPAKAQPAATSQSEVKHQPLNIKTGLWETTSTLKMSGDMPIPAGMLDKLTPEQRARLDERMKGQRRRAHPHLQSLCDSGESEQNGLRPGKTGMHLHDPNLNQHRSQGQILMRGQRRNRHRHNRCPGDGSGAHERVNARNIERQRPRHDR